MALRFKYRSVERPQPLGPKASPVIPIRLLGANGNAFDTPALVDSGADFSVIFEEHCEILGIDLKTAEQTDAQGIGGKVKVWNTRVDIEFFGKGEHKKFHFRIPVMVLQKPAENHPILLGRAGFFDHFEITFREKQREIRLKEMQ